MATYQLSKKEEEKLKQIKQAYYMAPSIKNIDAIISKSKNPKKDWKNIFDQLHDVLSNTKLEVDKILEDRKKQGVIKDIPQTRKNIAGNAFSNLVVYTFTNNKLQGNIKPNIFITSKKSQVKGFDEIATIHIGNDTQKPDVDLIVYTEKADKTLDKCIILSLKTSLRERAGQTYKWKLLMEIATIPNPIRDKYDIRYSPANMPLVCFATVNFYNEIDSPQHKGMFKFFDNSFIAKPINKAHIKPLSHLINYVNTVL